MPNVVHCKSGVPYDIYIGRPGPWGNPYQIGIDGTREEVIEKFEKFYLQNAWMQSHIGELKGKILGCFCYPLPCHGDILVKYAEAA
jgi:hypothetical protein